MQHFASGILITKILKQKTLEGLAFGTQIIFLVGALIRCVWVFETRLINEPVVWIELVASVVISSYIVYLFQKYRHTVDPNVSNPFDYRILFIVCLIPSVIFHPGTKNEYGVTMQMLISFTMFVEACGLLPQIYLIRKVGECEMMTGRYLICLGISRFMRMIFWLLMYWEGDTFLYLVAADLIHTALLGDFVYYYMKNKNEETILLR